MAPAPLLVVVVGHGPGVGAGHLGRCLALSQAWKAGGGTVHLVDDLTVPLGWIDRYRDAGAAVGQDPRSLAGSGGGDEVVVIDSYAFGADEVERLRGRSPLVLIDDHGTGGRRPADLVVDQNLGATAGPYSDPPSVTPVVLAGPRYALLRREVVAARPVVLPDRIVQPRRLLVAAGGAPEPRVSQLFDEVAATVAKCHDLEIVPLQGVTDVGAVLNGVDLVLTAAGSTVWELALFGLPSVVVAVADNQRAVARALGAAGAALDAGDLGELDEAALVRSLEGLMASPSARQDLATRSFDLVDGRGAARVAAAARATTVTLQRASAADADLLLAWANDPDTRALSFDPRPISRADHVAWFDRLLATSDAALWIGFERHGRPVGQVRVEGASSGTGVVSVSVALEQRGKGWAAPLLVAAAQQAEAEFGPIGLRQLRANVLGDNRRSARAFLAADFDRGVDETHGTRPHQTYYRRGHG